MAGTLTKEQRERRATAVRELLAEMRQAYEEDPTTRALRELLAIVRGTIADTIADPQAWAACAAYEAAERRRLLAFIDRHQPEIDGLEDAERMWT